MSVPARRSTDQLEARLPAGDPFAGLERLSHQLGGLLDTWRQQLPDLWADGFRPPADVEESDDAYLVEIELPGIRKDDLDIEVTGRRLTVSGERKEKERVGILRRRERTVGRFRYEVVVPGDVDEDGVEAGLDEGVLTVRLPKPVDQRPRRITVN
jgi:HSP20 family protein